MTFITWVIAHKKGLNCKEAAAAYRQASADEKQQYSLLAKEEREKAKMDPECLTKQLKNVLYKLYTHCGVESCAVIKSGNLPEISIMGHGQLKELFEGNVQFHHQIYAAYNLPPQKKESVGHLIRDVRIHLNAAAEKAGFSAWPYDKIRKGLILAEPMSLPLGKSLASMSKTTLKAILAAPVRIAKEASGQGDGLPLLSVGTYVCSSNLSDENPVEPEPPFVESVAEPAAAEQLAPSAVEQLAPSAAEQLTPKLAPMDDFEVINTVLCTVPVEDSQVQNGSKQGRTTDDNQTAAAKGAGDRTNKAKRGKGVAWTQEEVAALKGQLSFKTVLKKAECVAAMSSEPVFHEGTRKWQDIRNKVRNDILMGKGE